MVSIMKLRFNNLFMEMFLKLQYQTLFSLRNKQDKKKKKSSEKNKQRKNNENKESGSCSVLDACACFSLFYLFLCLLVHDTGLRRNLLFSLEFVRGLPWQRIVFRQKKYFDSIMATSSFSRRRKIRDETENTFDQTLDKECTQKDEDRLQREHFLKPDSDQIDLNLLLDAVLDINAKLRTQEIDYNESADFLHRRPKGKEAEEDRDSKFLQEMLRCKSRQERGNYSFRNDEVFEIDRENQRLLKEITRRRPRSAQSTRCNKSQTKQHEPHRLTTSSEVNRLRFQKRIEQENQALLRRIQAAKPDRSLDREYLMKNEVKPRLRPSSANNRKHVPRLAASSTTSAGMSTRAMSARDYHKTSYPRKSGNEKHDTSPKPAMRKMKPAWEAGW